MQKFVPNKNIINQSMKCFLNHNFSRVDGKYIYEINLKSRRVEIKRPYDWAIGM